jgi:hypothetical protein
LIHLSQSIHLEKRMTRTVLWCAIVGGFAASTSAVAAGPAYPVKDGIMQFPNVVVVNKPMEATQAPASQAGLRAYIDENGKLRAPTGEELQAEAAANPSPSSSSGPQSRRVSAVRATTMADGTEMATLDDSTLLYSVVVRQADGSLAEVCVPGTEAEAIVSGKVDVKAVAHKEQQNDR